MTTKVATLALLALPSVAFAHRLDECLQSMLVAVEPTRVSLKINLTPGIAVADEFVARIDADRDGEISKKEAAAYAGLVKGDLSVKLDGSELDLKLAGSEFSEVSELRNGEGTIRLEFTATPARLAAGAHTLAFTNRHFPDVSTYQLNAARPKSQSIRIVAQKRDRDQHAGRIDFTITAPVVDVEKASRSPGG